MFEITPLGRKHLSAKCPDCGHTMSRHRHERKAIWCDGCDGWCM